MGNYFFKLWGNREARVLFLGLDAAGKTTAIYRLKLGEVVKTTPTVGFNVETVVHNHVHITAWDVGGRHRLHPVCRHYYHNTQGLVYVVDSCDKERLDQALEELTTYLRVEELVGILIAIMANKQDLPNVIEPAHIFNKLHGTNKMDDREWSVFGVTCITGEGLFECMDWLSDCMFKSSSRSGTTTSPEANVYDYKEQSDNNRNESSGSGSKDVSNCPISKDVPKMSYFTNVIQGFRKIFG